MHAARAKNATRTSETETRTDDNAEDTHKTDTNTRRQQGYSYDCYLDTTTGEQNKTTETETRTNEDIEVSVR